MARIWAGAAAAFITVVLLPGGAAAGVPSPTPSATPTDQNPASQVVLDVLTNGAPSSNATVTVVANLDPATAWGEVSITDNGAMLASAQNYRLRWSYTSSSWTTGRHHLVVSFDPDPSSGFSSSHASVDYVVPAVVPPAAHPTPKPHKSHDPQTVVVTVPVVKATSTVRPTSSPTPSSSVGATGNGNQPPSGSLPFTGMDSSGLVQVALGLVLSGLVLVLAGRRRGGPRCGAPRG